LTWYNRSRKIMGGDNMAVISMFFGIIISMYFRG
jgi:nitrogen fixation protein FixH